MRDGETSPTAAIFRRVRWRDPNWPAAILKFTKSNRYATRAEIELRGDFPRGDEYRETEMHRRVILAEGSDFSVSEDALIRVTAIGLYRIMEIHASGARAFVQIDRKVVVEFEAAADAVND